MLIFIHYKHDIFVNSFILINDTFMSYLPYNNIAWLWEKTTFLYISTTDCHFSPIQWNAHIWTFWYNFEHLNSKIKKIKSIKGTNLALNGGNIENIYLVNNVTSTIYFKMKLFTKCFHLAYSNITSYNNLISCMSF